MRKIKSYIKQTFWYKKTLLNKLYYDIQQVLPLEEIGYHEIKDGKLNPIHKTETNGLSSKLWKEIHLKTPVHIKDNPILIESINERKTIALANTHEDERSSKAFGLFGIDSILVIPVIDKNNEVKSFIIIPAMKKFYNFTEKEVSSCEKIVKSYSNLLL